MPALILFRTLPIIAFAITMNSWTAEPAAGDSAPAADGPVKVLSASWIGGSADDQVAGTAILSDGTVLLAGNALDLTAAGIQPVTLAEAAAGTQLKAPATEPRKGKEAPVDNTLGFVMRLSKENKPDKLCRIGAKLKKIVASEKAGILVLGDGPNGFAGLTGSGTFIARVSPDLSRLDGILFHKDAKDFDADSNGEIVILSGAEMTRYTSDLKSARWTAKWEAHGGNRPGGMSVNSDTGIAAVVGYGMTHTGHEPYKDPYAYGFDRDGKQVWSLWNPDPKKECDAKFGGNGLMADTTGLFAAAASNGGVLLSLRADGGNTVVAHDPSDPFKKLDSNVFAGVFQATAGYGFKGASATSVIFHVDSAKGTLQKGTFMCAWLTKAQANGLFMKAATSDSNGNIYVVGGSASGCPTKLPWYQAPEGGYKGGGFLAIFDKNFALLQCGYFPGSDLRAVSCNGDKLVVAGKAPKENTIKESGKTYPVPVLNPVQVAFGGGVSDGYVLIFDVRSITTK